VEVVAGLKPEAGKLSVTPHIPKSLEGSPLKLDLQDPAGRGRWQVEQRYDGQSYSLSVKGTPVPIGVLTPPLPAGLREGGIPQPDGRMRYQLRLEPGVEQRVEL
jgi:hypothetical protein